MARTIEELRAELLALRSIVEEIGACLLEGPAERFGVLLGEAIRDELRKLREGKHREVADDRVPKLIESMGPEAVVRLKQAKINKLNERLVDLNDLIVKISKERAEARAAWRRLREAMETAKAYADDGLCETASRVLDQALAQDGRLE